MIAICVVDWCAAAGSAAVFWIVGILALGWLAYRVALLMK